VLDRWLNVREFSSRERRDSFTSLPDRVLHSPSCLSNKHQESFSERNAADRKADYSLPSNAEVKDVWSFTSAHPVGCNDVRLKNTDSFALFNCHSENGIFITAELNISLSVWHIKLLLCVAVKQGGQAYLVHPYNKTVNVCGAWRSRQLCQF
jgi:hypothetical protein